MPTDLELLPPTTQAQELDSQPEILASLEILKQRKENGYVRGSRSDGNYVALSLGPGGWAGEISMAMAAELDRAGLLDCVDMIIGSSIGGVQAIYAATGEFKKCFDAVQEVMIPAGRIPKMETLKKAVFEEFPPNFAEFPKDLEVVVGVTTLDNFGTKLVYSSEHEPQETAMWAIRGCHVPWLGGPPSEVDGERLSDTGIAMSNTAMMAKQINKEAAAGGNEQRRITHLLALENILPAQPTRVNKAKAALYNRPVDAFIKHYDPKADPADTFAASISGGQFSDLRAYKTEFAGPIMGNSFKLEDGTGHNIAVERVYPPDVRDLARLTSTDERILRRSWDAGRIAMLELLNPELKGQLLREEDFRRKKPLARKMHTPVS